MVITRLFQRKFVSVLLRIPSIPTTIKYQTRLTYLKNHILQPKATAVTTRKFLVVLLRGTTNPAIIIIHSTVRGSTDGGTRSECTRFLSAIFCLFFVCVRFVCEFKWYPPSRKLHYVSTNYLLTFKGLGY